MHQFEYKHDKRGKLKVTPKDLIKKTIGRSPDRFDSLALSVWEPQSLSRSQLTPAARALVDAANDNGAPLRRNARAPMEDDSGDDPVDSYDALKAFR